MLMLIYAIATGQLIINKAAAILHNKVIPVENKSAMLETK